MRQGRLNIVKGEAMRDRRTRYVVMPRSGVVAEAMTAALIEPAARGGPSLMAPLGESLRAAVSAASLFEDAGPQLVGAAPGDEAPASAMDQLATEIRDEDYRVLSQTFDDGPAMVSLTSVAKLGFEAANPGVRILPVTRYALPDTEAKARRRRKPAQDEGLERDAGATIAGADAEPAGKVTQSARDAAGTVWSTDFKGAAIPTLAAGNLGTGVNVAVIDTGVDGAHPALAGSLRISRCLIADANPAEGRPVNWGAASVARAAHGTHVAGIIAARPGFGGPEGVAPAAGLCSYRIFPDNAGGEKGAENIDIINAIIAAIRDGCHVINLSIEGAKLREDGVRSAITEAWNQGVICVAAAGNGFGGPVSYPAAHPNCVAVTALGKLGAYPARPEFRKYESATEISGADPSIYLAAFSNFGPQVQFAAPGHAIISTFPDNQWWFDSGTSMAAPYVAGILARVLSNTPAVLNAPGDAARSAAMLGLLIGGARALRLPQRGQEGYGLAS
jgi:subtilisin family serine protease